MMFWKQKPEWTTTTTNMEPTRKQNLKVSKNHDEEEEEDDLLDGNEDPIEDDDEFEGLLNGGDQDITTTKKPWMGAGAGANASSRMLVRVLVGFVFASLFVVVGFVCLRRSSLSSTPLHPYFSQWQGIDETPGNNTDADADKTNHHPPLPPIPSTLTQHDGKQNQHQDQDHHHPVEDSPSVSGVAPPTNAAGVTNEEHWRPPHVKTKGSAEWLNEFDLAFGNPEQANEMSILDQMLNSNPDQHNNNEDSSKPFNNNENENAILSQGLGARRDDDSVSSLSTMTTTPVPKKVTQSVATETAGQNVEEEEVTLSKSLDETNKNTPSKSMPLSTSAGNNPITTISILGERNTGAKWVTDKITECFPGIEVRPGLTRPSHWFQSNETLSDEELSTLKKKSTLIVSVFLNAYDWVELMRKRPVFTPDHKGKNWRDFVTLPWAPLQRPEWDVSSPETASESEPEPVPCQFGFAYNEIISCAPALSTQGWNAPMYELNHDGSGRPYDNILELRRDKILNWASLSQWDAVAEVIPTRYELLTREGGLSSLVRSIENHSPQLQANCSHSFVFSRKHQQAPVLWGEPLDPEYVTWMKSHVDWTVESMIKYDVNFLTQPGTDVGYDVTNVNDPVPSSDDVVAGAAPVSSSTPNTNVNNIDNNDLRFPTPQDKKEPGCNQNDYVDVFITTGQSNAWWPNGTYDFGEGVEDILMNSREQFGFSEEIEVVKCGAPGRGIASWFLPPDQPSYFYKDHFYGGLWTPQGRLEETLITLMYREHKVPRFRGLFWFQGETDGDGEEDWHLNTPDELYEQIWDGMIRRLEQDVGSSDFFIVMNTVGNSGPTINRTLKRIVDKDPRAVLFDAQVPPYRTNVSYVHGYDHFAVGQGNAQLFLDTFGPNLLQQRNSDDCRGRGT